MKKISLLLIAALVFVGFSSALMGCVGQSPEQTSVQTTYPPINVSNPLPVRYLGEKTVTSTAITPVATKSIPEYRGTFVGSWCLNSGQRTFWQDNVPNKMDLKSDNTVIFDKSWKPSIEASSGCTSSNIKVNSIRWTKVSETEIGIDITLESEEQCSAGSKSVRTTETWGLTLNKSISELAGGPGASWVLCE